MCGGVPGGRCPPKRCATDPDFSWQGQWPVPGSWETVHDPVSGGTFPVWEGHYVYPGSSLSFVPTFAGGMFEGLMANLVVPETRWGPHSFGLNDLRWTQVQARYATDELHYPVWGLSPSSTPDDTGGYATYGAMGLTFGAGRRLGQRPTLRDREGGQPPRRSGRRFPSCARAPDTAAGSQPTKAQRRRSRPRTPAPPREG